MQMRIVLLAVALGLAPLGLCAAADGASGQVIYVKQCASCHGTNGEGVADMYDEVLYGDRSLNDLTKIINDTMPDEAPEECVGEQARQVAEYMYATFYTAEARAKNQPPRVEASRLTVRQYQNVAADLFEESSSRELLNDNRGLRAEYYNARSFKKEKRIHERVDPQIRFSFGDKSPDAEKIGVEEFSMRWQGSLIAEETGEYEFWLKTENGSRLWVNDTDKALIDAWVSSGGEVMEHRQTLHLLGGRVYPIKVEYFKYKDKSASIELLWSPPGRDREVIPERNLTPQRTRSSFVVTTRFPPDDGSVGYERGTAVSKSWYEATTFAAVEIANHVVDRLDRLAKTKVDAEDRKQRVHEYCRRFAERAFRRPLTPEQTEFFIDSQFSDDQSLESAVKRVVLLVLSSPRFLYPELGQSTSDDYDVASRLSFGLWDSLPDQQLLKAAEKGQLHTEAQVADQARRMLEDPRARSKVQAFFHHWLQFDEAEDVSKDPETFPGFDSELIADLRTSLEMFIDSVVWSESADFRQLLLADYLYVNGRLAEFYGIDLPADATFQRVSFDPKERSGVLTHPYLLAAFAYHKSSSPIHRGVFLTRKLLGRALKPPPMAIQFMDGRFDPHLTMREKVSELTGSAACQTCHSIINPLGFSLEHYDAVGRFRTIDKERPIDATSDYTTLAGEVIHLTGARDVAEHAVGSAEAQAGFVEQLFHHLAKQPVNAYGSDALPKLKQAFTESKFNIQQLMIAIMKTSALHGVSE